MSKCADCRHFHQGRNGGQCRAHSPAIFPLVELGTVTWRTKWPEVEAEHWCGEFDSTVKAELARVADVCLAMDTLKARPYVRWVPDQEQNIEINSQVVSLVTTLAAVDLGVLSNDGAWETLVEAVNAARDICRRTQS